MRMNDTYYKPKPNLLFCIALPAYSILFVTIINSTLYLYNGWHNSWDNNASLSLLIIAAIELVTVTASRCLFCFTPLPRSLNKNEYIAWLLIEMVVCSLFIGLFLSIFRQTPYLDLLPRIMLSYFCFNFFPYILFWVGMLHFDTSLQLAETEKELEELRKGAERNDAGMVRFCDEKGNTKLVASADRVIALESAGNYVNILYDDNGKLVRYSLRNTLKGVEKVCSSNGLVRCHRSYFVNLNKIKIIRRTAGGVYAEMDVPNANNIPVSKTYAPELLRLFSES